MISWNEKGERIVRDARTKVTQERYREMCNVSVFAHVSRHTEIEMRVSTVKVGNINITPGSPEEAMRVARAFIQLANEWRLRDSA